jgi:signal transduction histidine kinase
VTTADQAAPRNDDGSRTQHDALEALSAAIGAVAGVLDVESVLQLIVDRVRALVGARYAAIGIVGDRGRIESFITSGISPAERARLGDLPEGHGLLGLIITDGLTLRIPEIAAHPASYGFPPNHPPMHSLLGVPVRVKNRNVGNLYLTDKIGAVEFDEDDQRLVELFALHAGIAIENARLHEAVQRLAVVDERERISKDLHDGVIQDLYAISLSLEDMAEIIVEQPDEAAARVDLAIDAVHATIGDLRGFITGLRGEILGRSDLVDLLIALAEPLTRDPTVEVDLDLTTEPVDLPAHARSELLHVAREALSNVIRHAGAARVRIGLAVVDTGVRLEVVDDGIGFDPDVAARDGHYGVANMRDRATALGGNLQIEAGPAGGTRIIVSIPRIGAASDIGPTYEEDARP